MVTWRLRRPPASTAARQHPRSRPVLSWAWTPTVAPVATPWLATTVTHLERVELIQALRKMAIKRRRIIIPLQTAIITIVPNLIRSAGRLKRQKTNWRSWLRSSPLRARKETSWRRRIKSCRMRWSSCSRVCVKWSPACQTHPSRSQCSTNCLISAVRCTSVTARTCSSTCFAQSSTSRASSISIRTASHRLWWRYRSISRQQSKCSSKSAACPC